MRPGPAEAASWVCCISWHSLKKLGMHIKPGIEAGQPFVGSLVSNIFGVFTKKGLMPQWWSQGGSYFPPFFIFTLSYDGFKKCGLGHRGPGGCSVDRTIIHEKVLGQKSDTSSFSFWTCSRGLKEDGLRSLEGVWDQ